VKSLTYHPIYISVIVLFLGSSFLFTMQLIQPVQSISQPKGVPKYGWVVCEDLGFGDVPGHHPAQRFKLCNQNIWEVFVHCIDETIAPPSIGTACERVNQNTYWCGDQVQPLRHYEILPTLTPFPTDIISPTFTPILTSTSTATQTLTSTPMESATSTPTHSETSTPTHTETSTPNQTLTSSPTLTPEMTLTEMPTHEITPSPTVTPTKRPRLGGSGNLQSTDVSQWLLGFLIIVIGITSVLADWAKIIIKKR